VAVEKVRLSGGYSTKVLVRFPHPVRPFIHFILGLLLFTACNDGRAAEQRPAPSRELIVRILDVGQGDAILIQNGGSNVLIDGGPDLTDIRRHLEALGIDRDSIQAMILTHAHADHYRGLQMVIERSDIPVRYFWENGDPSSNSSLAQLRAAIARRVRRNGLVYRDTDDPCANGAPMCTVTLRGGAKLHIMRPDPRGEGQNNRSAALKLVGPDSASFTMWLAGDAERDEIRWFERAGYARSPGMKVDVLKANHHGSSDGVSDRYLDLLRPRDAVVSLAAVNDYGHMHDETRRIFTRRSIPWYRTDQNGTITIRSPGTPGSGYTISVERGSANARGPSDGRRARR
jgi:competence protein ComEC